MLPKTLQNLHIHVDANYKKHDFSRLRIYRTPAGTYLLCQQVCNILSIDVLKKSRFEFCF